MTSETSSLTIGGGTTDVWDVFLGSPSDAVSLKKALADAITEMNGALPRKMLQLRPINYEIAVTAQVGVPGQRWINEEVVKSAQILFAVFNKNLGTAVSDAVSGTVSEIQTFVENDKGKNAVIFFKQNDGKTAELEAWKKDIGGRCIYLPFRTADQLKNLVKHQLFHRIFAAMHVKADDSEVVAKAASEASHWKAQYDGVWESVGKMVVTVFFFGLAIGAIGFPILNSFLLTKTDPLQAAKARTAFPDLEGNFAIGKPDGTTHSSMPQPFRQFDSELLGTTAEIVEQTSKLPDRSSYRCEIKGKLHVTSTRQTPAIDVDEPVTFLGTFEMLHTTPIKIINLKLRVKPETTASVGGLDIAQLQDTIADFVQGKIEEFANKKDTKQKERRVSKWAY